MEILEYYQTQNRPYWLEQIGRTDWRAGQYLSGLLGRNQLKDVCGKKAEVFMLVEGDALLSFCVYGEQDEIRAPELAPWVGFVYTFPEYRGKRRAGKLLEYAYGQAKRDGYGQIYISTGNIGLYEKYGASFWKVMKNTQGEDSRVYRIEVVSKDYGNILGTTVKGRIDRPLGSVHPKYPDMVYPVNYGFVEGVLGGDGQEQDAYVFGTDKPLEYFSGKVEGVYRRLNDQEDKWIVNVGNGRLTAEEVLKSIWFQEQYYMGELYGLC